VLAKIDQILAWEASRERDKDTRFVELGRYLCEVRVGQYWRIENLQSFDEFLTRRFPGITSEGVLPDEYPRAATQTGSA
jgi:hypothetical protein